MFNGQSAFENSLAIRWFTPRGSAAIQAFLVDLSENEGRRSAEILSSLRRRGVPEGRLDLRGADFRGETLAGLTFPKADLSGAIFAECDLRLCDLSGSTLVGARFVSAKLRGAKLVGACLEGADLRNADLREADLSHADMEGAQITGAEFARCVLAKANLEGVDRRCADLSVAIWRQPSGRVVVGRRRRGPQAASPGPRPGRPPATEPRRKTTRKRPRPVARKRAPEANSFDLALSDLLSLRGSVERIVVVVDGVERVLLGNLQPLAPV